MIRVAKTAGFCFGVNRAVETVYKLLDEDKTVCTLGPIIHNPQLVEELGRKGVRIIDAPEDAKAGETVVIRSHGVPPEVIEKLKVLGVDYKDATCPYVQKIHRLVSDGEREGRRVMLAGDAKHPEVEGILGCCKTPYRTFKTREELENLFKNEPELAEMPLLFCEQTTFNVEEWEKCLDFVKKVCTNASVFDTICKATTNRQREARELSRESDLMLVIGGRHSSNTAKLKEVCEPYAQTYLIETAAELAALPVKGKMNIGITAGASTPASIIKEVLVTMTDKIETNELNFEEMLEESLKSLNTDEKVHGVVVSISPTEVYVDVGRKQAGYIPANELSNDPNAKPEDLVKIGDEMDLLIMKTNDQEGTIMLSKKRIDAIKGWEDIAAAMDAEEILTGKVTEVVKGGVIVLYNGIRVFIPASQAVANRGDDLEALKGQDVQFRIIEVNRQRRRAVGSIRSVLREQRKAAQAKFWESVEEGQEFTGTVKSLTNFGAFVDLGGVDGMIHISELSWNRIKPLLPQEEENETDEVKVKKTPVEALKVKHLSFTYPDGKKILDDISFSAKKGQIIGITGAVACGKSTLGKAFLCEYPYEGHITVDGAELQNMEQSVRTGIIGYLGHDPELFNDSVENNVLLGDSKNSDTYLNSACMKQEVAEMTDGKNTLIGSGGAYLSGGQAKRLAFARTLCHDKPILILDDPFSALDKNTEKQAFVNLQALAKDSIVLLISHRLYLFPEMDGVIWMENGKAVTGTHEELLKIVPEYESLYTSQVHTTENGGAEHDAQKASENGDL